MRLVSLPELSFLNKKNSIRILHVDDDPCFLEVTRQLLSMENHFEIDIVTSVDEALEKMENLVLANLI